MLGSGLLRLVTERLSCLVAAQYGNAAAAPSYYSTVGLCSHGSVALSFEHTSVKRCQSEELSSLHQPMRRPQYICIGLKDLVTLCLVGDFMS